MLHTLWMHASSEQFSKLNYVERGLSRLCGGHGELPHEVLWRNLMELCELRRSLVQTYGTLIHSHHAHLSEVKSTVPSTPPICWSPASNFKGLAFAESIANANPWCVGGEAVLYSPGYTLYHLPRLHICIHVVAQQSITSVSQHQQSGD